ncbi:class I SAM-dependent methyltransferase [Halococcus salsus]|uniref:class I SAM-dependent methyltransferase n=1 Tax=Halococcus salsus TaxID=2162894 RepID=UPI00135AE014
MDDAADPFAALNPENYYNEYGNEERKRLQATRKAQFEFENTIEYLREHLPDRGHVLDAGGGAGRYTVWLAEQDYEVTLVDLSDEQCRIAREKVEERGLTEQATSEAPDSADMFDKTHSFLAPTAPQTTRRFRVVGRVLCRCC